MAAPCKKQNSGASQHKRRRVERKIKSVQFNPQVKLRCVMSTNLEQESWLDINDIRATKAKAKGLAKHYYLNNIKKPSDSQATTAEVANTMTHPARYEMNGDSLRGMEHLTDLETGKRRQLSRARAIRSVNDEQCRQLLVSTLASWNSAAAATTLVFRVDTSQLARVYGEKTEDALEYSRRLAQEDAEEAAAILSADL